jgi:hypothetical protein
VRRGEKRAEWSELVALKLIDGEEVGEDDVIVMGRQPLTICERVEAKLCRCVCHDKFIARLDLTQGRVTRGAGGRPRGDGIAGAAVFDEAEARDTFNPTLDGGGGLPGLELTTRREGQQAAEPQSLALPQTLAPVGSQRVVDAREGTEGGDNVTVVGKRRYSVTERSV